MNKLEREVGYLKTYDALKGYGFIERPHGKNVFVSYKEFQGAEDAGAIIGSLVSFTVRDSGKGPRAFDVQIIG